MREYYSIDIQFDNKAAQEQFNLGEQITGQIILQTKKDFILEILGYDLILATRGSVNTEEKKIHTQYLLSNTSLLKNKTYSYPIKIQNDSYESFNGYYVEFYIKFEVFSKLDSRRTKDLNKSIRRKSYEKKTGSLLSRVNLGQLITDKEPFKHSLPLHFKPSNTFQVLSDPIKLKPKYYSASTLLFIPFFAIAFIIGSVQFPGVWPWALTLILLAIGFYIGSIATLGDLVVELKSEEGKLKQIIRNSKRWKLINKVNAKFQIQELAVEGDGDYATTNKNQLYQSEVKEFKRPNKALHTSYDFPKKLPPTIELINAGIHWEYVVKVKTTLGFTFTFKQDFIVKKGKLAKH